LVQRAHDFQQLSTGWGLHCRGCGITLIEVVPTLPLFTINSTESTQT
jgi:hypothetical protein